VDLSGYKGTCYRAANWIYLGKTKGFSKRNRHYYPNNHPKGVFVYPLFKDAKALLKAELLPYDFNLLYRRDFMEALRQDNRSKEAQGYKTSFGCGFRD